MISNLDNNLAGKRATDWATRIGDLAARQTGVSPLPIPATPDSRPIRSAALLGQLLAKKRRMEHSRDMMRIHQLRSGE